MYKYKRILFSGLITLGLITLSAQNSSLASSTDNEQVKQEFTTTDNSKKNQKTAPHNLKINFASHLVFNVSGSRIVVKFAPQNPQKQALQLDDLAADLGYQSFNWVNYVERDPYGITDYQGNLVSIPYNDPPSGGYQYDAADAHPFYWDIEECESCRSRHHYQHPEVKQSSYLTFEDHPSDSRLKPGEKIEFVTHLVGIKISDSDGDKGRSQWEVLTTFKWQLTNNVSGSSQVSLIGVDLDLSELSPALLAKINSDGGIISDIAIAAPQNQNNSDNPQSPQQNRQNPNLDILF
jgi:hypothetical protein